MTRAAFPLKIFFRLPSPIQMLLLSNRIQIRAAVGQFLKLREVNWTPDNGKHSITDPHRDSSLSEKAAKATETSMQVQSREHILCAIYPNKDMVSVDCQRSLLTTHLSSEKSGTDI